MALTSINIEQLGPDRWFAEVEVGFTVCKTSRVTATSAEGILAEVGAALYRSAPEKFPALEAMGKLAKPLPGPAAPLQPFVDRGPKVLRKRSGERVETING